MSTLHITVQLDRRQSERYLRWLLCQYEQTMAELWYSDRYRYTPEGLRAQRVLADHPHIAAISRTLRELRRQIREVAA